MRSRTLRCRSIAGLRRTAAGVCLRASRTRAAQAADLLACAPAVAVGFRVPLHRAARAPRCHGCVSAQTRRSGRSIPPRPANRRSPARSRGNASRALLRPGQTLVAMHDSASAIRPRRRLLLPRDIVLITTNSTEKLIAAISAYKRGDNIPRSARSNGDCQRRG